MFSVSVKGGVLVLVSGNNKKMALKLHTNYFEVMCFIEVTQCCLKQNPFVEAGNGEECLPV